MLTVKNMLKKYIFYKIYFKKYIYFKSKKFQDSQFPEDEP